MLFRSYKKRDSTLPIQRIRYSEVNLENPFSEFSQNEISDMATIKKVRILIIEGKKNALVQRATAPKPHQGH